MDTNIIGQSSTGQTTSANRFAALVAAGNSFASTATGGAESIMPCVGTLKNLYVNCDAGPGASITRTFTVQKNGSDTSLTVSLTGAGTGAGVSTANDTTDTVNFSAGDALTLRTSATGTTTNSGVIRWTLGATCQPNTSFLSGASAAAFTNTVTNYMAVQGLQSDNVTANNVEEVIPTDGTLRNAYIVQSGTSGAAASGKNYAYTLFKNGSSTAITMTVSETATTANDTSHTVSVSAGDRLYWQVVPTSTPSARQAQVGLEFDPNTNGESVQMYGGGVAQTNSAQRFQTLNANLATAYSSTESPRQALTQACIFKKFYIFEQTTIIGTWQYQLDVNGSAGNPSVTITSGTTANDTTNIKSVNTGDTVSMSITPTSLPAGTAVEWGIVSYIKPPSELALIGVG